MARFFARCEKTAGDCLFLVREQRHINLAAASREGRFELQGERVLFAIVNRGETSAIDAPGVAALGDLQSTAHAGLKSIRGGEGEVLSIDFVDMNGPMVSVFAIKLPGRTRRERFGSCRYSLTSRISLMDRSFVP